MTAKRVETAPIEASHCIAKLFYYSEYKRPNGSGLKLEFDVTYFLDVSMTKPKIFGFMVGDEMALYKQHGPIPSPRQDRR